MYKIKLRIINYLNLFLNFFNLYIDDVTVTKKDINHLIDIIKPMDLGHNLVRVGSKNDGGYLMPDLFDDIDYCFSPGIGKIYDFEKEIEKKNIKLFLADGTIDQKNIDIKNFDFLKKNLSSYNSLNLTTLGDWIKDKIEPSDKLLLQMDIEGSEYEVINSTSEDCLKSFKVIIIEFHYLEKLYNRLNYNIFVNSVNKIIKNFEIAHLHANNCHGEFYVCGEKFPTAIEITFLRKDLCLQKKNIKDFPHPLDKKNIRDLPDIILSKKWYS